MRPRSRVLPIGALATALVLFATPSGNAQTDGARTLTFFEDGIHGTFKFVDAAPKSRTKNLASKRFRFTPGDELVAHSPLLTTEGGDRIGMGYVTATAVVGGRLRRAVMVGTSVLKLRDGQIVLEGVSELDIDPASAGPTPVVGGSGAYEGARGAGR
jgi:hypothetical protein